MKQKFSLIRTDSCYKSHLQMHYLHEAPRLSLWGKMWRGAEHFLRWVPTGISGDATQEQSQAASAAPWDLLSALSCKQGCRVPQCLLAHQGRLTGPATFCQFLVYQKWQLLFAFGSVRSCVSDQGASQAKIKGRAAFVIQRSGISCSWPIDHATHMYWAVSLLGETPDT